MKKLPAIISFLNFCLLPAYCQSESAVGAVPNSPVTTIAPMPLTQTIDLSAQKADSAVEPTRTISLRACFEDAFTNNREIAASRASLPVAQAAVKIAGAVPNPKFTLLFGWGPEWRYIIAGQPEQFGLQFDLQTAGKRTKQLAVAHANYKMAELQVAQLMFDVHNRVRRAYAEQAAAEAYEELIEAQRKVALDLVRVANSRFQAGKAPRSDLLQAQLGAVQLDIQRNQSQSRLQQASAALSLITGGSPRAIEIIDVDDNGIFKLSTEKTDLVPSPARPLPPLDKLIPLAYAERPDMKVQVQQTFSDRRSVTLARAQRIPDLYVDSGYQFTIFKKDQPYNLFNNPNTGLPTPTPNVPGCYLNITVETPIWYRHQGEVDQAKATWLQDYDQIKQIRAQIATDSLTAYESVVGSRANIFKFQNELLPEAATVAKQAFRRYQVGKADLASAILARQQYQQMLSSYFDAVVSYQNAWADLERAIGVSLNL
jgi:cobalt-zinc-cadmium efflux system outer membrane protein